MDNCQDIYKIAKIPGGQRLAKALQKEANAFLHLETQRDLANTLLEDLGRLKSNIRVPQNNLSKLEAAVIEYEAAITAVVAASEEPDNKVAYKEKITAQIRQLNPILNKLFDAVNAFKPPEAPQAQANKAARLLACIRMKICAGQMRIETNIGIVTKEEIDADALNALPKA